MPARGGAWEPVIGLEIHAQLLTRSKAFCPCATSFGEAPNTRTCPVCLGLPGSLPVLNAEAVSLAVRAALALGCVVQRRSSFARKSYFYPDLPKGYQLTQLDEPLALGGALELETGHAPRRVAITQLHLEEDAGKTRHVGERSLVDLNRAGMPLIEIVIAPELRSPAEARELLRGLRELLMVVGVCDGNMERGSLRCDANVSLRRPRAPLPSAHVELKNLNSFRFVHDALAAEIDRQRALLELGEQPRRQTRGYDPRTRTTALLRDKEEAADYRYFAEPDLPPLELDDARVAAMAAALPELPQPKRRRYVSELGLDRAAARVLTAHPATAALFEQAVELGASPARAAQLVQGELLRDIHTAGLEATLPIDARQLCELCELLDEGRISGAQAKQLYASLRGTGRSPAAEVEHAGLSVLRDEAALRAICARIVAEHPAEHAKYRTGRAGLLGFFVGKLLQRSAGRAEPALGSRLLRELLER
jgi:aspartyl-tRNA(Asn)/glutamyl-tRNA(Gln) amidotransferase subunit B